MIAFICVLDGWRLDLLSVAYTSNWWPGERNRVVSVKVKVLSQLITLTFLLFLNYIVSACYGLMPKVLANKCSKISTSL